MVRLGDGSGVAAGLAAHALDELHGRPLGTAIPDRLLWGTAAASLAGAVARGIAGISRSGPALIPFLIAGVGLVRLLSGCSGQPLSLGCSWPV